MTEMPENLDTDTTSYSLDDEDQLPPEDTLMGTGDPDEDVLDAGYSPPDRLHGSIAHGVTAEEQARDETIDERIRQEVPDPHSAYGAPDNESGLDVDMVGGDDPDAIPADADWLGGPEVGGERAGRLVDPAEGLAEDHTAEAVGEDVGVDGGAASAEEAAMHVIDDADLDDAALEGEDLADLDDLTGPEGAR